MVTLLSFLFIYPGERATGENSSILKYLNDRYSLMADVSFVCASFYLILKAILSFLSIFFYLRVNNSLPVL